LLGIGLGIISSITMGYFLFEVQKVEKFPGIYPGWLLGVGGIFMALAFLIAIRLVKPGKNQSQNQKNLPPLYLNEKKIARQWALPILAILVYMHAMVFYLAITGKEFL